MLENIAYQQLLEIRDKMRELGIYEIHNENEFRKAVEGMAHSWGSEAVLVYHSPKEMALDFDYKNGLSYYVTYTGNNKVIKEVKNLIKMFSSI